MPLFVADYLADTRHLTPAQHGAYLLLIMNYWQRGQPLPNDDTRLARIVGMSKRDWAHNRDAILEFFSVQENMLHHRRIDDELSRVEAKSLKCKDAAQASVERRFSKRSTPVERTLNHTDNKHIQESGSNEPSARELWANPPVPVSKQVWEDFKRNRKAKKLGLTASTYAFVTKELARVSALTGIPPPQLLEHAAASGWGGIYDPNERKQGHERSNAPSPLDRLVAASFGAGARSS